MKNNNWIWIVLVIVGIYLFMQPSEDKKTISTVSGGNFGVDILDYTINNGYLDAEIKVSNLGSTSGEMYVEAGVYILEDNLWLNNYKKQSIIGRQLQAYNCVPNQPNVQNIWYSLYAKDSWTGGDTEIGKYHLQIPTKQGTLILFTEAFKQCASEGDPGVTDYKLLTISETTQTCGDGICSAIETTASCPSDCKVTTTCQTGQVKCSDGVCRTSCGGTTTNCQFFQDPKDCSKIAMWVWIVGGLLLFMIFISLMR